MTPTSPKAEAELAKFKLLPRNKKPHAFIAGYESGYSAASSRWIPVSERLPEDSERVLIHMSQREPYEDSPYTSVGWFDVFASSPEWIGTWPREWNRFVTHWQHLPKPPTEQP